MQLDKIVDPHKESVMAEFERRKRARQLTLPTDNHEVKMMLRLLEQPICEAVFAAKMSVFVLKLKASHGSFEVCSAKIGLIAESGSEGFCQRWTKMLLNKYTLCLRFFRWQAMCNFAHTVYAVNSMCKTKKLRAKS